MQRAAKSRKTVRSPVQEGTDMQRAMLKCGRMILLMFVMIHMSPAPPAFAEEIAWKPIQGGLLYTRMETGDLRKGETATVHIYSIDASRYRLRFFDCLGASDGKPLSLARWYEQTDALLIFNVCSDAEQGGSAPFLRASGRTLQSGTRQAWKGLLVSDATGNARPSTRIIDLQFSPVVPSDLPDSDVYQEPMLLDEKGEIRVNPRPYEATRVALAEDRHRNLLVFLTEEPCRLWDLAKWLQQSPFSLLRAMDLGRGNTVQVLGRHPADRVYILGPTRSEHPVRRLGTLPEEAATEDAFCCVMGVVHLP